MLHWLCFPWYPISEYANIGGGLLHIQQCVGLMQSSNLIPVCPPSFLPQPGSCPLSLLLNSVMMVAEGDLFAPTALFYSSIPFIIQLWLASPANNPETQPIKAAARFQHILLLISSFPFCCPSCHFLHFSLSLRWEGPFEFEILASDGGGRLFNVQQQRLKGYWSRAAHQVEA